MEQWNNGMMRKENAFFNIPIFHHSNFLLSFLVSFFAFAKHPALCYK